MATLRETYVLSPRKLKKTSGVSFVLQYQNFVDTVACIHIKNSNKLQKLKRAYP